MPSIPKPDKETLAALAAAGYPDPGPPKPGLIAEAFPAVAAAAMGSPIAGALAGFEAAAGIADASQTKGSIGQYLIGSGGAAQSDSAPTNAILSALNRLAGFKSRL